MSFRCNTLFLTTILALIAYSSTGVIKDNLKCFEAKNTIMLIGHTQESIDGLTVKQCLQQCLNSTEIHGFNCHTINYVTDDNATFSECNLSGARAMNMPDLLIHAKTTTTLYINKCANDV